MRVHMSSIATPNGGVSSAADPSAMGALALVHGLCSQMTMMNAYALYKAMLASRGEMAAPG